MEEAKKGTDLRRKKLAGRKSADVWLVMASACAGIFVFGMVMAGLGSLLPSLFTRIDFGKSEAGNLFFVMNLAMLVMSMVFGPIVDRFSYRVFLIVCSFFVFFSASTYRSLVLAALLLGLGGGGLNGGSNALASDLYPERRSAALNTLGIFFGFGALAMPFLIGSLEKSLGLERLLALAMLLSLVPFSLFLLLRFPEAKQAQGFPLGQAAKVIRHPLIWWCGFLLFFQSGNEFTVGGWVSSYLHEYWGLSKMTASFILAGYWAALMTGRLVSTRLVRLMRNEELILVSALVSLTATGLLVLSPIVWLTSVAGVLAGLGFAAIFPTTLALVGEAFPSLSGTSFGVVFVIALSGGMMAPWLAGKLAAASTLRTGFLVPFINSALIVFIALTIRKRGHHPYLPNFPRSVKVIRRTER